MLSAKFAEAHRNTRKTESNLHEFCPEATWTRDRSKSDFTRALIGQITPQLRYYVLLETTGGKRTVWIISSSLNYGGRACQLAFNVKKMRPIFFIDSGKCFY